jgi:prepilin-type processing-associated H-X9-DG protein
VGNGSAWNDGSSYPSEEHITNRHYKGANLLFFDGHVEWWFPVEFDRAAQFTGPNLLWCNPISTNGH